MGTAHNDRQNSKDDGECDVVVNNNNLLKKDPPH